MPGHHVLVVDDNADLRESVSDVLELQGYTVEQAENGAVALSMVADRRPALMLLDLMMPVMDGWQVIAHMHANPELRDIPLVVISAAVGRPPPNVMFIQKPAALDELLTVVAQNVRPTVGPDLT